MSTSIVPHSFSNTEDSLLLSQFITEYCSSNPEKLFARVINLESDSTLDGVCISARQLLEHSRRAAEYLKLSTDSCSDTPINVAILAHSGYDYLINFVGLTLNCWTPVLISTRNSLDAIVDLIQRSGSSCLVVDESHSIIGEAVAKQLEDIKVAKLYNSIDNAPTVLAPRSALWKSTYSNFELTPDMPALYLHSSGTTGHPKLIPIPHRTFLQRLRRKGEVKYCGRPSLAPVPMFHTMGILATLGWPMVDGPYSLIMESRMPVTSDIMIRMMHKYPGSVSIMAPATLLDMIQHGETAINVLKNAHRVIFAGASLPCDVGNQLASQGVKLMTLFGTTETGGLARDDLPSDDPNDWEYFKFKDSSDIILSPIEGFKNLARAHVKPGEFLPPALIDPQDPYGFTSGDIFERHPEKKDLWKHAGRKSSVTVLSNGEKTDNEQLERLLRRDALISNAVVFGTGHFQNGVIILPASSPSLINPGSFIDDIWETVEHANAIIPHHSRLVRSLVLIADSNKGFVLSDKGTVRREPTLDWYKDEIERAYDTLEKEGSAPLSKLPSWDDGAAVLQYIRDAVFEVTRKFVDDGTDLFDEGMDSLSALTLRSSLLSIIRSSRPRSIIPRNIIYRFPTISRLANYICGPAEDILDAVPMLDRLVEKFTADVSRVVTEESPQVVLLTGSTGTFGSQVLACLLRSSAIAKVICLNRDHPSLNILQRHRLQMDDPGLLDTYSDKVVFAKMETSLANLGMDQDTLEMVLTSVTLIIHCAWGVNFNYPLERFVDTHIAGVKHLARIALSSKRRIPPRFVFISSIASVGNYPGDYIPERIFDDVALPLKQGYGQSKYVAEHVLNRIALKSGLRVTIVRVGQLSGSTLTGHWNKNEYIFLMLQASITVGKFPEWLPDVRWMPTDIAAKALVDIVLSNDLNRDTNSSEPDAPHVYHLESPAITRGVDLVQWTVEFSNGALEPVPYTVWLEEIGACDVKSTSVKAVDTLHDFFETWLRKESSGRAALSIGKVTKLSSAANCDSVSKELFSKYYDEAAGCHNL